MAAKKHKKDYKAVVAILTYWEKSDLKGVYETPGENGHPRGEVGEMRKALQRIGCVVEDFSIPLPTLQKSAEKKTKEEPTRLISPIKNTKDKLLVFYYAGHGAVVSNGAMWIEYGISLLIIILLRRSCVTGGKMVRS